MSKTRRKFTAEFKAEAVQYYQQHNLTITQAAKDLGISATSMDRWVKRDEIDKKKSPEGPLTSKEREELRNLRKENRTLRMEADILKKAAAFFARNQ